MAYLTAAYRFADWCEVKGLSLEQVEPMMVAAYIEQLTAVYAPPTVKQYLAAIRMLFDWLVIGQVDALQPGQLGTGSQARCENRQDTGADGRGNPRPPRFD